MTIYNPETSSPNQGFRQCSCQLGQPPLRHGMLRAASQAHLCAPAPANVLRVRRQRANIPHRCQEGKNGGNLHATSTWNKVEISNQRRFSTPIFVAGANLWIWLFFAWLQKTKGLSLAVLNSRDKCGRDNLIEVDTDYIIWWREELRRREDGGRVAGSGRRTRRLRDLRGAEKNKHPT